MADVYIQEFKLDVDAGTLSASGTVYYTAHKVSGNVVYRLTFNYDIDTLLTMCGDDKNRLSQDYGNDYTSIMTSIEQDCSRAIRIRLANAMSSCAA